MSKLSMARTAIISPNPVSRVLPGRCGRRSRSIRVLPAKCRPPRVSLAADCSIQAGASDAGLYGSWSNGEWSGYSPARQIPVRSRRISFLGVGLRPALAALEPALAGYDRLDRRDRSTSLRLGQLRCRADGGPLRRLNGRAFAGVGGFQPAALDAVMGQVAPARYCRR